MTVPEVTNKAKILVLDTAPLINQTQLHHLAERFVTIPDVLGEVRDAAARRALAQIPFTIETMHPSEESIAAVSSFSKLTGDYPSLSLTDLRVLALTWQLTMDTDGPSAIRTALVTPGSLKRGGKSSAVRTSNTVGRVSSNPNPTSDPSSPDLDQSPDRLVFAKVVEKPHIKGSPAIPPRSKKSNRSSARSVKKSPSKTEINPQSDPKPNAGTLSPDLTTVPPALNQKPTMLINTLDLDTQVVGKILRTNPQSNGPSTLNNLKKTKKTSARSAKKSSSKTEIDQPSDLANAPEKNHQKVKSKPQDQDSPLIVPREQETDLRNENADSSVEFGEMQLVNRKHKKPAKSNQPWKSPAAPAPETSSDEPVPSVESPESLSNVRFNQLPGFVDVDSDNEAHDEKGWITPSNVTTAKQITINGSRTMTDQSIPSVACMSADFAVQNVLLQMGLHLLSLDGIRVHQLRNWLLRCHACFRTTTDLERRFCASCGGNTLMRVSYSIVDGQLKLHLKKNFQYRLRGTTYTVPKYQPGRNTNNIILCEDQREFQLKQKDFKHHMKKASQKTFDDHLFGTGPIRAPSIGYGSRNPNQVVKMRK